jgi:hypothetical protein
MLENLSPPKTMYTPAQAEPHLFGLESGEGGGMCRYECHPIYYLWHLIHDVKKTISFVARAIYTKMYYLHCI